MHLYIPEMKRPSREWRRNDKTGPQKPKIRYSAGKILDVVFWDLERLYMSIFFMNEEQLMQLNTVNC